MNVCIFYNENGVLNRNKLKENWVKNNLPDLYLSIISFKLPTDISHFSQKMYHYMNDMNDYPECSHCSGLNKRYQSFTTGYKSCCSKSCTMSLIRPTIEINRRHNTLKKHGVAHTSMLLSVKNKQRITNELIYGHISPSGNKVVQEKIRATNLDRYGVEYVMQNADIKNTFIENRTRESIIAVSEKYKLNILNCVDGVFEIVCGKCNSVYKSYRYLLYQRIERYKVEPCINCNPLDGCTSRYEDDLYNYLNNYNIKILRNHRINNKEMDIYLPDFNLGIEINGLYWHSELYKDKNYHIDKTNFFKSIGINIIHIWEDDWLERIDIVKHMILDRIGLSETVEVVESDCILIELCREEIKDFLMINAINGYNDSKIHLGLSYNNELVSVMSFSNINNYTDKWSIDNCSNSLNYSISTATKIIKYFTENNTVNYIEYLVDNSHHCNKLENFRYVNTLPPDYHWCKNQSRYDKLYNGITGCYKIWDVGKLKYTYDI